MPRNRGFCSITALEIRGFCSFSAQSTVVKEFASEEYRSFILIDFSEASEDIRELFNHLSDLDYFFLQLQFRTGVRLHERESLVVFDEVQRFPRARQAIKHLVADGRYDFLETGSFIPIKKNVENILIPSEEKKIQMHPMDFEEFPGAAGKETTFTMMESLFQTKRALGEAALREGMRLFRLYMVIGGMPQAVSEYLETNNLQSVDEVKRPIIDLYEDDFYKIDPSGVLSLLFDNIPGELSTGSTRYNVSGADSSRRPSDNNILSKIAELASSRTVLPCYHTNDPGVGLSLTKDLRKFKLYLADTGLFITLAFKDRSFTDNLLYRGLMSDKLPVNLGYVYENITAGMLSTKGDNLFYHTFYSSSSKHTYEIDFLLSRSNRICPVEVKSSSYLTHTSLDMFHEKYHSRISTRYLVYPKDYRKDGDILCIPPFFVPFI